MKTKNMVDRTHVVAAGAKKAPPAPAAGGDNVGAVYHVLCLHVSCDSLKSRRDLAALVDLAEHGAHTATPAGGGMGAVFGEINQGGKVTAGLKRVTADMKTKNMVDRTHVVAAGAKKAPPAPAAGVKSDAGKPRPALEEPSLPRRRQRGCGLPCSLSSCQL